MAYKVFQLRRDAAADWASNNPTLAEGEPDSRLTPENWLSEMVRPRGMPLITSIRLLTTILC